MLSDASLEEEENLEGKRVGLHEALYPRDQDVCLPVLRHSLGQIESEDLVFRVSMDDQLHLDSLHRLVEDRHLSQIEGIIMTFLLPVGKQQLTSPPPWLSTSG